VRANVAEQLYEQNISQSMYYNSWDGVLRSVGLDPTRDNRAVARPETLAATLAENELASKKPATALGNDAYAKTLARN
jgi:hypothetical protein